LIDFDYLQGLSFLKYKKYSTPIRVAISGIIAVQLFGFYQFPPQILYPVAVLAVGNLLSITVEKAKLSTVEIAERKCKICNIPMYSKMIKCEKCNMQIDTDEERNNK
jgi:hypothetical protein